MTNFNFLSKSSSQSCGHSSVTLASTVGSPSIHRRGTMLKLISVLVLVLTVGVGNAWGANATFSRITSTADLTSGAKYLIVYESGNQILDGSSVTNGSEVQSVTISSNTITCNVNYAFTITGSSGNWTIKGSNNNVIGHSGSSNTLNTGSFTNTISFSGNNVSIGCHSRTLKRNQSNAYFRYYSSGQNAIQLYKEVSSKQDLTLNLSYSPNPIILGEDASSSPTLTGNTGNGTVTYSLEDVSPTGCMSINSSTGLITPSAVGTAKAVASVAETTNYKSGTKKCDVSIVKKYTVILGDDASSLKETTVGSGVTLPSRDGCTGYKFEGWSTTNNTNWTTTAPSIIKAGSYSPTADITLYPVYTKSEGGGVTTKDYTITFNDNEADDNNNELTTSNFKDQVSGNADSISSVSATAKCFAGNGGLKMSSGKYNGSFTLNLAHSLPIKKVVLNTKKKSTTNASYEVEIGSTSFSTSSSFSTTSFVDVEFTGTKTTSNSLTVRSKASTNQGTSADGRVAWLHSLTIYFESNGSTTSYISVPNCCTSLGTINGSFS